MSDNRPTNERVVAITGQVFEAGPDGWCKHCGWAMFAHVIGATTGALYCPADKETVSP